MGKVERMHRKLVLFQALGINPYELAKADYDPDASKLNLVFKDGHKASFRMSRGHKNINPWIK